MGDRVLRWRCNFVVPNEVIYVLKGEIEAEYRYMLEDGYEEYLIEQKKKWMSDFSEKLLGDM